MRIDINKLNASTVMFPVKYSLKCDGAQATPGNLADRKRRYLKRLKLPGYKCYVAAINSEPVGYIDTELRRYDCQPALWINEVYVRTGARGKGIAGKLIAHACKLSKKAGARALFADTEPGNAASIRALQKCGFRPVRHTFKKKL